MSDSLDPVHCSRSGSSVHGISQARILEWVTTSYSRGSSGPKNGTCVSCLAGRFFTTEPPGKLNHSPTDGYLDCLHIFAISIHVIMIFLDCVPACLDQGSRGRFLDMDSLGQSPGKHF